MKKHFVLFIFVGLLALIFGVNGCSTFRPIKDYVPVDGTNVVSQSNLIQHVIQVDRDGDFYPIPELEDGLEKPINKKAAESLCWDEKINAMNKAYSNIFKGMDEYVQNLETDKTPRIAIIIHGGLSTPRNTLIEEQKIVAEMNKDQVYPIFVNWRSGMFTTLKDHFFRLRDGEVSSLSPWTSPLYIAAYGCKMVGEAPLAWGRSVRDNWKSLSQNVTQNVLPPKGWDSAERFHLPPSEDYRFKLGESILYNLGYPSRVVTVPFVFSLGTPAWKGMKRRCDVMFSRQNDMYTETDIMPPKEASKEWLLAEQRKASSPYPKKMNGAVYTFVQQLSAQVKDGRWKQIQIDLIGHSMGSIVLNRILKTIPELPVSNIVHMASADSLQNYRDITIPYVKTNQSVNVYNLFLHPRNEYTEKNFAAFVPVGSLLSWIDHSYERPEFVLKRTAGRWENMRQIVKLIDDEEFKNRIHYKVFGRNAKATYPPQPQKHGHFNDVEYEYWQEKFWK